MTPKNPVFPQRIRKVPKQFSWVDHRLVRDRHIERCSHQAAALYLFLVTVADSSGLSYYSNFSLTRRLSMDENTLEAARDNLVRIGLIAYRMPIYQVLPLDDEIGPDPAAPTMRADSAQPTRLSQIFKQIGQMS